MEWGGEWDNCNSIINKYIKKKRKKENLKKKKGNCQLGILKQFYVYKSKKDKSYINITVFSVGLLI